MLCLCFGLHGFVQEPPVIQPVFGEDVGVKLVRSRSEVVEELYAKDQSGQMRLILVSPTHPAVDLVGLPNPVTAIVSGSNGLFSAAPSFRFTKASSKPLDDGWMIELTSEGSGDKFVKRIFVPKTGNTMSIRLDTTLSSQQPRIQYLLSSYAFAPDGKKLSAGGKPDSTFCPGFRPGDSQVVGDHFFRAPAVVAQQGTLAATLMPDLDVLAENRPMPTIIDLDAKNRVVDATLLSYGFCDQRLTGHVYFSTSPSMMRRVPNSLALGYDLMLDAKAIPHGAYGEAATAMWAKYGQRYFDDVKPQALPFAEYARVCIPAAINEGSDNPPDKRLGWFEVEIDGKPCGGIMAGWGYQQGWVSWQSWFNNLRSAWGMKWFGSKLPGPAKDWEEKAHKMLNLALAAPMDRGACPTTYMSREKQWKGCLIMPSKDCYYDLTNMAWKGIWLLRWYTDFKDCPRKDEILKQCREMADCMMRNQNADGSYPTWLTKDHKVVSYLDHSAQSSLPAWFLFELAKVDATNKTRFEASALKASDFLLKEVVDQQRYYDFETFFSCSPKPYPFDAATNLPDNDAMMDHHSLQPPQNTLCMQWSAEALRGAFRLKNDQKYMVGAIKALDMMALYQNVWPISYRKIAYTYGGFGVQNSDGEYHDARQAQFGVTLCQFGAELGRKDLFERGVAAVRASLALINHPMHAQNDIYPNPNYPLGLMPENCGHGGVDHQNGRTGFDWGEGSGLTSMAFLLDRFGGVYVDDKAGWAVGIDGVAAGDAKASTVITPLPGYSFPWTGQQKVTVKTRSGATREVIAEPIKSIRRLEIRPLPSGKFQLVAIPSWTSRGEHPLPARFVIGDKAPTSGDRFEVGSSTGKSVAGGVGPEGYVAEVSGSELSGKVVWTELDVAGKTVIGKSTSIWVDPAFTFAGLDLQGWTVDGTFAEVPTASRRFDFNAGGQAFIGTCEDGQGGFDDSFTGTITSPRFFVSKDTIKLRVGGGSGEGVYVELIRADTGERLFIERGRNREFMDDRVWKVSDLKGVPLQIRAVDRETGGWGHINVGLIRVE